MSERSIVIAYEDDDCDELHRLLKALRRDVGQSGVILEARPVKGTGQFVNEVPKLLRERLKQTKRPPDRVVCVADADKPTSLVPDAKSAPTTTDLETLQRWVCDFEASWLNHLKREGRLQEESAMRLQAVCLRRNKESLLIASLDALRAYAAQSRRPPFNVIKRIDSPRLRKVPVISPHAICSCNGCRCMKRQPGCCEVFWSASRVCRKFGVTNCGNHVADAQPCGWRS